MIVYVFSYRYSEFVSDNFVQVYVLVRTDTASVSPKATKYESLPDYALGEIVAAVLPDGAKVELKYRGGGEYRTLVAAERDDLGEKDN